MKQIFTAANCRFFTLFCFTLMAVNMVFSPFLLSLSMWGLVIAAFWNVACDPSPEDDGLDLKKRVVGADANNGDPDGSGENKRNFLKTKQLPLLASAPTTRSKSFDEVLKIAFRNFFKDKELLAVSLLFAVVVASGLWSENLSVWLERSRVRIPFFVLPFAFANLCPLSRRDWQGVLAFLFWVLVLTCIGIGANYLLHSEEVMRELYQGRHVPVPRNHIRFNLILAMGILSGGWLFAVGFVFKYAWERWAMLCATLFLFVFIHVLSVRSGLVALYMSLIFSAFWLVFVHRKWLLGLGLLLGLAAMPVAALRVFPTLKQKLDYARWDFEQYQSQKGENYSDSERIVSIRAGWELAKRYPVFGTGIGDLPAETERVTAERFPAYSQSVKLPHNQFLYILASTGIVGLLLSLWAFYGPLLAARNRRFYLFAVFQVVAFASFLVEYTLETAMGAAFYLFFYLVFLKMRK